MRLAIVSLIAAAAGAAAYAQSTSQPAAPPTPPTADQMAQTSAPGSVVTSPGTPDSNDATNATPPVYTYVAPPPPPPPPPPAPPTDPTAIATINVLEHVCIPAANGGNLPQVAKAAGYRKNSDNNWVLRGQGFQITVEDPGSNPTQCHVDLSHPVVADSPGKPIIVALNDWAGVEHGWSLYRNDKNVQDGTEFTTRSWTHTANNKIESLVFVTMRKPDGTPLKSGVETSQMVYGVQPAS